MLAVCLANTGEGVMLSFEVSVIDVVLMLAVLVLLVLYMTNQSTKSVSKSGLSVAEEKDVGKPLRTAETQESIEKARFEADVQTSSPGCPQHFGYLKERPKDAQIPDECFQCSRMAECF